MEELILSQIKVLNQDIGQGSYGKVYEVEYRGVTYAAKKFHLRREGMQQTVRLYLEECMRCSRLRHPGIVTFIGVYFSENAKRSKELPIIIMERMASNLATFVRQEKTIAFDIKISIISDVAQALTYLHNQDPPIVHCNLSSNNVFVMKNNEAKVGDFGVSQVIKGSYVNELPPLQSGHVFMPLEAQTQDMDDPDYYKPSLDVFLFAGIILHTFTQQRPTPCFRDPKTNKRIALSEVGRRSRYFDLMTGASAHLKPLIEHCLDEDPTMRPSMADVCRKITSIATSGNLLENESKQKNDLVRFMIYYLL